MLANDIAWALPDGYSNSLQTSSTLAPESRLDPFIDIHLKTFQDRAALFNAIGELKKLVGSQAPRHSQVITIADELAGRLNNENIEIDKTVRKVELTGGKDCFVAVFNFKKQAKSVEVVFLKGYAGKETLSADDRQKLSARFGISKETDLDLLDSSGLLRGVWFVKPPVTATTAHGTDVVGVPPSGMPQNTIKAPSGPANATLAFRYLNSLLPDNGQLEEAVRVMVTDRCNLNCSYCMAKDLRDKKRGDIEKEKLCKIIDQLRGFKRIEFNGAGETTVYGKTDMKEPGLSRDFIDLITYASERTGEVRIVTNGYLIPEDMEEARKFFALLPSNVVWVISIDGIKGGHRDNILTFNGKDQIKIVKTVQQLAKEGAVKVAYYATYGPLYWLLNKYDLSRDRDEVTEITLRAQGAALKNGVPLDPEHVNTHTHYHRTFFPYIDMDGNMCVSQHVAYETDEGRSKYSGLNFLGNVYKTAIADIFIEKVLFENFETQTYIPEDLTRGSWRRGFYGHINSGYGPNNYSSERERFKERTRNDTILRHKVMTAAYHYLIGDINGSKALIDETSSRDTSIMAKTANIAYQIFMSVHFADMKGFLIDCIGEERYRAACGKEAPGLKEAVDILSRGKDARCEFERYCRWFGFPAWEKIIRSRITRFCPVYEDVPDWIESTRDHLHFYLGFTPGSPAAAKAEDAVVVMHRDDAMQKYFDDYPLYENEIMLQPFGILRRHYRYDNSVKDCYLCENPKYNRTGNIFWDFADWRNMTPQEKDALRKNIYGLGALAARIDALGYSIKNWSVDVAEVGLRSNGDWVLNADKSLLRDNSGLPAREALFSILERYTPIGVAEIQHFINEIFSEGYQSSRESAEAAPVAALPTQDEKGQDISERTIPETQFVPATTVVSSPISTAVATPALPANTANIPTAFLMIYEKALQMVSYMALFAFDFYAIGALFLSFYPPAMVLSSGLLLTICYFGYREINVGVKDRLAIEPPENVQKIWDRLSSELGANSYLEVIDSKKWICSSDFLRNKVTISTRVIGFCNNDNELAMLLGHEMAELYPPEKLRLSFGELLLVLSGFKHVYRRKLELQADNTGMQLMIKAGFASAEGIEVFRRIEKIEKRSFLAVHPPFFQRITLLEDLVRQTHETGSIAVPPLQSTSAETGNVSTSNQFTNTERINELWASAEKNLLSPDSEQALDMIIGLGRQDAKARILNPLETEHRICAAHLYGRGDYEYVISYVEGFLPKNMGVRWFNMPDGSTLLMRAHNYKGIHHVLGNPDFQQLYLMARMMDAKGIDKTAHEKGGFFAHYLSRLAERGYGEEVPAEEGTVVLTALKAVLDIAASYVTRDVQHRTVAKIILKNVIAVTVAELETHHSINASADLEVCLKRAMELLEVVSKMPPQSTDSGCIYSIEGGRDAIIKMAQNVESGDYHDVRSGKVRTAIENIEKKTRNFKLSGKFRQYQPLLAEALKDLNNPIIRTEGIVLSSRNVQKEDDYALGFHSRAPPVKDIITKLPGLLVLADQVLDNISGTELEEYLLHEALCHLCPDHATAKAITKFLYQKENYEGCPHDNGRLGLALRGIIDNEASSSSRTSPSGMASDVAAIGEKEVYAYTVAPLNNAQLILRYGYYGPIGIDPNFIITKEYVHTRDLCRSAARQIGLDKQPVVIAFKVPRIMLNYDINPDVAGLSGRTQTHDIPEELVKARIEPGILFSPSVARRWEMWRKQGRLGYISQSLIDIEETYGQNRKIFNRSFPNKTRDSTRFTASASQGAAGAVPHWQDQSSGMETHSDGISPDDLRELKQPEKNEPARSRIPPSGMTPDTDLIGFINPHQYYDSMNRIKDRDEELDNDIFNARLDLQERELIYRGVDNGRYLAEAIMQQNGILRVKGGDLDHPQDMVGITTWPEYARIWVGEDGFLLEINPRRLSKRQPQVFYSCGGKTYYGKALDLCTLTDTNKERLLNYLIERGFISRQNIPHAMEILDMKIEEPKKVTRQSPSGPSTGSGPALSLPKDGERPAQDSSYRDFLRETNGSSMPLEEDPLSANTVRDLHLALLSRFMKGSPNVDSDLAKDHLERYFGRSAIVTKEERLIPDLCETLIKARMEHPLRNMKFIEKSYDAIRTLLAMPADKRAKLADHIFAFYRYYDHYGYTWHHYNESRTEHLFSKTIFYLAKMSEHLDAIRSLVAGTGFEQCLRLPKQAAGFLREKEAAMVREYFARYPTPKDDEPPVSLRWYSESMRALEDYDSRKGRTHKYNWETDPLSPFWQLISDVREQDRRGEFTPELSERAERFKQLQRELQSVNQDRLNRLPDRLTVPMEELLFAFGGFLMMTEGHYSIPASTDEPGIIHLEEVWNPIAGRYEDMDKLNVDIGGSSNFFGITGANEIGKSTTIEAVALAVLYYQMGLPVPAKAGTISVFRNIYTAVPGFETLEPGESQHTALVKRLTELIKHVGPRDLIIIDEAHMGSDYKDLTALTSVLMQDLIATGATVVYATHLKSAMKMLEEKIVYAKPERLVLREGRRSFERGIAEQSASVRTLESLEFPPEIITWMKEYYEAIVQKRLITAQAPKNPVKSDRGIRDIIKDKGEEIVEAAVKILFPDKNFYYGIDVAYRYCERKDVGRWLAPAVDVAGLRKELFIDPEYEGIEPDSYSKISDCLAALDRMNTAIIPSLNQKLTAFRKLYALGLMKEKELDAFTGYIEKRFEELKTPHSSEAFMTMVRTDDRTKPFVREEMTDPREIEEQFHRQARLIRRSYEDGIMHDLYNMGLNEIDFSSGIALSMRENDLHFAEKGDNFSINNARSPFMPHPVPLKLQGDSAHPQFILTGPNKSGKTSAIRTLEVLMYLARKGFPVPAEMTTPDYDDILTFFGGEENIIGGKSYFNNVASYLCNILKVATPRSLVIMDELQGSDYWELSALQAAVIKYLDRIGCTVVLITHMREGLAAAKDISSLKFLKTDIVRAENGTIEYKYTISDDPGLTAKSYGIETVREFLTPDQYKRAHAIRSELEQPEAMPPVPTNAFLAAVKAEADRIHNESLHDYRPEKFVPGFTDKTLICHIITDSIVPVEQQQMLKTAVETEMRLRAERGEKFQERVVCLPGKNTGDPAEFIKELQAKMAEKLIEYQALGYTDIRFDVACPDIRFNNDTTLIGRVLGSSLKIKGLAFKPAVEGVDTVTQVEGIIMALRALDTEDFNKLKAAFVSLAQRPLSKDELTIKDLDTFIKRVPFILPATKMEDINERKRINDFIAANIIAAA